jgi:hypothetical protein
MKPTKIGDNKSKRVSHADSENYIRHASDGF